MISRLVSKAAVLGVAAAIAVAAPASAATTPTLSGPAQRTGFGTVTLTGTAAPGAAVHLYETAIGWNDLQPAEDWEHGGGIVTAKADSAGKYSIIRYLDSGFYFQTESGGARSPKITVLIKALPTFWVSVPSGTTGTLDANTSVSPNGGGLTVNVEKQSGSTWTKVGSSKTNDLGEAVVRFTGLATGDHTYRAVVEADPENGLLSNTSDPHSTYVTGTGGGTTPATTPPTTKPPVTTPPATTPPATTPPATTPPVVTTPPVTTTPPKTTPPATTAPPTTPTGPTPPAVGAVQFTKIQYDSPGTDTSTNASLNTEWVKLTNKTKATINLNGWTVRNKNNYVYKFVGTVNVAPGGSVFVLTGKGTNTATHKYWGWGGKSAYIWNNAADTATLKTGSNKTIDTCGWTKPGPGGYSMC